ncbi:hypothetical protein GBF38_020901 [Nibea albiflora]|uniref:Uncharacterized protein n=1 Tax=Nibea albiflora TaxID=240163 RepID=A0ACB7FFZ6_NIBAL|nr:hypothetical protein GBF38_020901 [Nibea albiflora]
MNIGPQRELGRAETFSDGAVCLSEVRVRHRRLDDFCCVFGCCIVSRVELRPLRGSALTACCKSHRQRLQKKQRLTAQSRKAETSNSFRDPQESMETSAELQAELHRVLFALFSSAVMSREAAEPGYIGSGSGTTLAPLSS